MAVISRAFLELGANYTGLKEGLEQAAKIAEENGAKLSNAGLKMVENFQNALNPTKQLAVQLEALEKSGASAGNIQAVLGDKIKYATEQATKNGQAVEPLVQKHYDLAKAADSGGFSFESFGKTLTEFARNPLQATQNGIVGMLEQMGPTAVGLGGIAVAAGIVTKELFEFANTASDNYERLRNLSAQTGVATDDLQALERITKNAGLAGMDLGRIIGNLQKQLGEKKGDFVDVLKMFNISMVDANGQSKTAITLLGDLQEYM